MPSTHLSDFKNKLIDFDEIISARDAICPSGAGRPAQRKGAAVVRGGIVLLSAAFEAYVEDVFDDVIDNIYAAASEDERKKLKKETSGRLNNASVWKVNLLFATVGLPWIMDDSTFHWQKFSNGSVKKTLDDIVTARNRIAHRGVYSVRKPTAIKWRNFLERLTSKFDDRAKQYIIDQTGTSPW
jgi:hypothetical protein